MYSLGKHEGRGDEDHAFGPKVVVNSVRRSNPVVLGVFRLRRFFRELDVQISRACGEELSDAKTQEVQRHSPRGRGKVPRISGSILESFCLRE